MAGPYRPTSLDNYVGIGKQASKGTGVAPTVFVPYMGAVDLAHGQRGSQIREGGSGLYVTRTLKEAHDPSGRLAAAWRPTVGASLAAWFLGADSESGADPYDHVITPSETPTWLSIEQNLEDELTERFVDGVLRRVTLSGEDAKDLMLAIEWFSLTQTWESSPATPSYDTGFDGAPHKQDQAVYTVRGSSVTNIRSWQLELTWTYDEDIRLSKVTRANALKLKLEARLTLRQLLNAATDYRTHNLGGAAATAPASTFDQDTSDAFTVVYNNGEATTDEREVQVAVPQIDWMDDAEYTSLNPDGTEAVYLEQTGVATKGSGELVTITCKTADSAAYV